MPGSSPCSWPASASTDGWHAPSPTSRWRKQGPDAVRRLIALAVTTPEDAERLRERLRLSNDEHERAAVIARLVAHLKSIAEPLDAVTIRRLVAEHGVAVLGDALAIVAGEPRPIVLPEALQAHRRFASGDEAPPVFPFRGADLLARGVPKGRGVGEALGRARAAWLAAGCPPDPSLDALLAGDLS